MLLLTLPKPLIKTTIVAAQTIEEPLSTVNIMSICKLNSGRRLHMFLAQSLHKRQSVTKGGNTMFESDPLCLAVDPSILGYQDIDGVGSNCRQQLMVNPII